MSFSPDTEKLVNDLIQAEYKNACEKFGETYHSLHEGYAVLLEEVEEVKFHIDDLFGDMNGFWSGVKENNKLYCKDGVGYLLKHTTNAMKELAQVGAVLMKIANTISEMKIKNTFGEVKESEMSKNV